MFFGLRPWGIERVSQVHAEFQGRHVLPHGHGCASGSRSGGFASCVPGEWNAQKVVNDFSALACVVQQARNAVVLKCCKPRSTERMYILRCSGLVAVKFNTASNWYKARTIKAYNRTGKEGSLKGGG